MKGIREKQRLAGRHLQVRRRELEAPALGLAFLIPLGQIQLTFRPPTSAFHWTCVLVLFWHEPRDPPVPTSPVLELQACTCSQCVELGSL